MASSVDGGLVLATLAGISATAVSILGGFLLSYLVAVRRISMEFVELLSEAKSILESAESETVPTATEVVLGLPSISRAIYRSRDPISDDGVRGLLNALDGCENATAAGSASAANIVERLRVSILTVHFNSHVVRWGFILLGLDVVVGVVLPLTALLEPTTTLTQLELITVLSLSAFFALFLFVGYVAVSASIGALASPTIRTPDTYVLGVTESTLRRWAFVGLWAAATGILALRVLS